MKNILNIFILTAFLSLAGICAADVTFYANFNRTVDANDISDPNTWEDVSVPRESSGSSAVIVSSESNSLIPGSYSTPRGTWLSPGIYISDANGGIRYEAADNVDMDTATIELYADRDFGAMSVGDVAKLLSIDFGSDDYIHLYVTKYSGGGGDYVQVRAYCKLDGVDVQLSGDYVDSAWPTTTSTPDELGFNHFLVSYDLSQPAGDRWIGLWVNGEIIDSATTDVNNNNIGTFSGDTSINQLTLGSDSENNANDFVEDSGLGGNIDAVRIQNDIVDNIYALDAYDDFTVPGLDGAEYLTSDDPTTFYVNFNNANADVNITCTPVVAEGNSVAELLGSVFPDYDTRLFGAWGTSGMSFYYGDAGLHYEAIDNIPRNNGTIEWYNNRYLPDCAGSGVVPRLMEVAWDNDYGFRIYIDDANTTEEALRLAIKMNMGPGEEHLIFNDVNIAREDFPYDSRNAGGSGMNHYALSWEGSSDYNVPDGWIGLWINGEKFMKFTINYPYFWGSGNGDPNNNTFAIGIYRKYPYGSSSSFRLGGAYDGIRVSALAIDDLYTTDANESFDLPGYMGDEYGEEPSICGDAGTVYLTGDLNQDCVVDWADLELFVAQWLQED